LLALLRGVQAIAQVALSVPVLQLLGDAAL
jgi:hypothetical protein